MTRELKKLRGFVVGENCYFYDYDFNFFFWKRAKLVNDQKKTLEEDGICYEVDIFSKAKIRAEFLKGDGKIFEPVLIETEKTTNVTELILGDARLNNYKKLAFKKANIQFRTKLTESNKFSFFLGVLFLVNEFFDDEIEAAEEGTEPISAIELSFSKHILDSGSCDWLPAAKTQAVSIDNEYSDFSWFFHNKFGFIAECRGYMKDAGLVLKS